MEQETCVRLIEQYKNHPVLWNPREKYFHFRNKREVAWREIAAELQLPVSTLKAKMTVLTGTFRSERSRAKKSRIAGSASEDAYKSKWFAYKHFDFLGKKDSPVTTRERMSQDPSTPRISKPKPTHRQLDFLVKFMEDHPSFARGKMWGRKGREKSDELWSQLAAKLNILGHPKPSDRWKAVWRNLKSLSRTKMAEHRDTPDHSLPGSASGIEERVWNLTRVGVEDEVAENYSSEGTDTNVDQPPSQSSHHTQPSVFPEFVGEVKSEQEESQSEMGCDPLAFEILEIETQQEEAPQFSTPEVGTSRLSATGDLENQQPKESIMSTPEGRTMRSSTTCNTCSRDRDGTHFEQEARSLASIAESHAESMKMLAQATAANAETNRIMVENMKVFAEALKTFTAAVSSLGSRIAGDSAEKGNTNATNDSSKEG